MGDWEELFSEKHKRKYWKNKSTGKTSWTDPSKEGDGVAVVASSTAATETKSSSVEVKPVASSNAGSSEWEELFSEKHKRKYWKHKTTGKTSWTAPETGATSEAPAKASEVNPPSASASGANSTVSEWEELYSEKHKRKYWKHKTTGKTSWTAPTETSSAVVSSEPSASTPATSASVAQQDEWEELYSEKHKRKYWKHKTSGKTSWTAPTSTPASTAPSPSPVVTDEWEELFNEKHKRKYWKNKVTGKTSWTKPDSSSVPPSAVPSAVTSPLTVVEEAKSDAKLSTGGNDEWEELFNEKHKRKYWKHKATGKTSWTPPPTNIASTSAVISAAPKEESVAKKDKEEAKPAKLPHSELLRVMCSFIDSSNVTGWAQLSGQNEILQLKSFLVDKENAIFATATAAILNGKETFSDGSQLKHNLPLSALKKVVCNKTFGLVEMEFVTEKEKDSGTGREATLGSESSLSSEKEQVTVSLNILFPNAFAAQYWLAMIRKDRKLKFGGSDKGQDSGIMLSDFSSTLLLTSSSSCRQFENFLFAYNQLLKMPNEKIISVDAAMCLSDYFHMKNYLSSPSTPKLIGERVLTVEEELTVAFNHFNGNFSNDSVQTTGGSNLLSRSKSWLAKSMLNDQFNALPLSGILVMKIIYDEVNAASSAWMPCWIRIDQTRKQLIFHEHGPSQPCTFQLLLSHASLFIKDLTGPEETIELIITNTELFDEENSDELIIDDEILSEEQFLKEHHSISTSLLFKTCEEMWRWALSISSIVETLTCQIGEHSISLKLEHNQKTPSTQVDVNNMFQLIKSGVNSSVRHGANEKRDEPGTSFNPLSFLQLNSTISDALVGLESVLAEREIASEMVRHYQINAVILKSIKFQIINNQRVLVQSKGSCEQIQEGSILLSVNGLSAIQLPGKTILKFISDMPKHMQVDMVLLKFPRTEFVLDGIEIEDVLRVNEVMSDSSKVSGSHHAVERSITAKKLDAESTNQLQRMIVRKRSILALPSNMQDVLSGKTPLDNAPGPGNQSTSGNANNEASIPKKEPMTIEKFKKADNKDIAWLKYRFTMASGKILVTLIKSNTAASATSSSSEGVHRFQLNSTQLKIIYTKDVSSLSDLCIELIDSSSKAHVILRCHSYKMFQALFRRLVIGLKLYMALPTDLAWSAHQAEKWKIFFGQKNAHGAPNSSVSSKGYGFKSAKLSSSGILSQMKQLIDCNTSISGEEKISALEGEMVRQISSLALVDDGSKQLLARNSLMQAAESLEQTLSSLDLPAVFPNAGVVEHHLRELRSLNKANHQLYSEILTMQYDHSFPQEVVITQKSQPQSTTQQQDTSSVDDFGGNMINDEGEIDNVSSTNDIVNNSGNPPHWDNDSASEGYAAGVGELTPVPPPPPQRRSSSIIMASVEAAQVPPPPLTQQKVPNNKLTRRASTRLTQSAMDAITGGMSGMANMPGIPSITSLPSSSNLRGPAASVPPPGSSSKFLTLSLEEQGALSSIFVYLRDHPHDIIALTNKMSSHADLSLFAYLVVNRLYHPWSCDQKQLEKLLELLLCNDSDLVSSSHGTSSTRASLTLSSLYASDKMEENKSTNPYYISLQDFTQYMTMSSYHHLIRQGTGSRGVGNNVATGSITTTSFDSYVNPFLITILYEIACRVDTIAFLEELCRDSLQYFEGITSTISSLTSLTIADICSKFIEPLAIKLEHLMEYNQIPDIVVYVLKLLSHSYQGAGGTNSSLGRGQISSVVGGASSVSLEAKEFLSTCIITFVMNSIHVILHRRKEQLIATHQSPSSNQDDYGHGESFLDEEQMAEILNKIRDLFFHCFDQAHDGGSSAHRTIGHSGSVLHGKKRLQLCLSDTAALSRSKWIFHRCLVAFENFDEQLANQLQAGSNLIKGTSTMSAVGQLSHLSRLQGKTKVLESFLCLRPSELLFFLQLFDLSNISSLLATSSSTRRQLSDAISTLNSTELVTKLMKYSVSSSSISNSGNNGNNASTVMKALRFYHVLSLDREVTYIINTDASTMNGGGGKDGWLDLLQYDGMEGANSTGAFNTTPFSTRDNGIGNLDSGDSLFLSSSNGGSSGNAGGGSSGRIFDDEDHPSVNELSSIQWLVNASRSVLKKVYEDTSIFLKGEATTRELMELRSNLMSKQNQVKNCLADWKKLQQSKEMLTNYKAQLSLLHDFMKNRKKLTSDHLKYNGVMMGSGNNTQHNASLVSSFGSFETYRYPLMMNVFRLPNTMLIGENPTMPKPLGWIPSDEEKELALLRMIHLQIALEKQLQIGVENAANTTRMLYTPVSASMSNMTPKKGFGSSFGSPLRISSIRLDDPQTEGPLPMPSPSTGGMNPLWAIMQNVFSTSISAASTGSTSTTEAPSSVPTRGVHHR